MCARTGADTRTRALNVHSESGASPLKHADHGSPSVNGTDAANLTDLSNLTSVKIDFPTCNSGWPGRFTKPLGRATSSMMPTCPRLAASSPFASRDRTKSLKEASCNGGRGTLYVGGISSTLPVGATFSAQLQNACKKRQEPLQWARDQNICLKLAALNQM